MVWPIYHRTRLTRRIQKSLAVSVWLGVAVAMVPFALTSNAYSPAAGLCYFWSGFSSRAHEIAHIAIVHTFAYPLPMAAMVVSYAGITWHSGKDSSAAVVATAMRAILAYALCSMPMTFLYLAKAAGARLCEKTLLHKLLLLLLVVNSVVNPLIYATRSV